jgi:hypothetical protein
MIAGAVHPALRLSGSAANDGQHENVLMSIAVEANCPSVEAGVHASARKNLVYSYDDDKVTPFLTTEVVPPLPGTATVILKDQGIDMRVWWNVDTACALNEDQ